MITQVLIWGEGRRRRGWGCWDGQGVKQVSTEAFVLAPYLFRQRQPHGTSPLSDHCGPVPVVAAWLWNGPPCFLIRVFELMRLACCLPLAHLPHEVPWRSAFFSLPSDFCHSSSSDFIIFMYIQKLREGNIELSSNSNE